MQIALLGRAADLLAARRARDVAAAGRQGGEDRIEVLHRVGLAADHHAVAALEAPDAAAGADIDIVDALGRQLLRAADVVDVVGVAAVDQDVAGLEMRQQIGDGLVDHAGRHHQPDRARLRERLDELRQRGGADGLLLDQLGHRLRRHVEHHAFDGRPSAGGAPCSRPSGRGRSFPIACYPPSASRLLEEVDELAIAARRSRATACSRVAFPARQATSGSQKTVRPTAKPMKPGTLRGGRRATPAPSGRPRRGRGRCSRHGRGRRRRAAATIVSQSSRRSRPSIFQTSGSTPASCSSRMASTIRRGPELADRRPSCRP